MVKLFPHYDAVAHEYYDHFPESPSEPKTALKQCLPEYINGQGQNLSGLRKLVQSFSNLTGGNNYTDPHLKSMLTRINLQDKILVVLYGIHTSNGEADAHVTIQRSVDTTEPGWNDLAHLYVAFNPKTKKFEWNTNLPPEFIRSSQRAKQLNSDRTLL